VTVCKTPVVLVSDRSIGLGDCALVGRRHDPCALHERFSERFGDGDWLGGILDLAESAVSVRQMMQACFVEGTLVPARDGWKAIEQILQTRIMWRRVVKTIRMVQSNTSWLKRSSFAGAVSTTCTWKVAESWARPRSTRTTSVARAGWRAARYFRV